MHQIYMYILCWQMPSHCTLSTECDSLQRAILQNNKVFLWHFSLFFFNDNNDVGSDCSLDNISFDKIDTSHDIIYASLEIIDKIISLDNIGISLDKIDITFDNSNIGEKFAYRYCKTNLFTYKTGLWNYYRFWIWSPFV